MITNVHLMCVSVSNVNYFLYGIIWFYTRGARCSFPAAEKGPLRLSNGDVRGMDDL